jgi:dTDP-4-dehydrorhamnose reductase
MLVLGAAGLLGTELVRLLRERGIAHASRSHTECDITAPAEVARALAETRARVVINCAAYNAVDRAESEPERALSVNRDGAATVAHKAHIVVHFSTDFVFDGRKGAPYSEADLPRPLSAYGRSKAFGDAAVRAANPRHYLIRVGCLYGRAGRNFPSLLLARLRAGERIRADAERRIQPTWGRAVAEQTLALASAAPPFGLYHAMCHGDTTWAEFARELARLAGADPELVDPVPTSALAAPAERPAYAVLENRALAALGPGGDRMPHWRDALAAYLAEAEASA